VPVILKLAIAWWPARTAKAVSRPVIVTVRSKHPYPTSEE
jgi:hypothetical protein